ncbi:MAG: hypothetical protein LBD16_09685, partial [Oscillospiraceae bacterium]|nr:hypothetical protein [Oscillospiraceae bacterium]
MNKNDYKNTIGLQIEELRELVGVQAEKCFSLYKLERILDYDTARKIKRVIITGCGDSYSAAGAMLPAFKVHSGLRLASAP